MQLLDNILAVEGEAETEEEYYSALQQTINSGSAWRLQGSYGRTMMYAIETGFCVLGRETSQDYWGNCIPSRDQVEPGTKGSIEYVAQARGDEWAEWISKL